MSEQPQNTSEFFNSENDCVFSYVFFTAIVCGKSTIQINDKTYLVCHFVRYNSQCEECKDSRSSFVIQQNNDITC